MQQHVGYRGKADRRGVRQAGRQADLWVHGLVCGRERADGRLQQYFKANSVRDISVLRRSRHLEDHRAQLPANVGRFFAGTTNGEWTELVFAFAQLPAQFASYFLPFYFLARVFNRARWRGETLATDKQQKSKKRWSLYLVICGSILVCFFPMTNSCSIRARGKSSAASRLFFSVAPFGLPVRAIDKLFQIQNGLWSKVRSVSPGQGAAAGGYGQLCRWP